MDNITNLIQHNLNGVIEELKELRRSIHAKPELGYQEYGTTESIKSFLNKKGLSFNCFNNLTGGFVYIDCKKEKTVGFRADIDALPMCENTCAAFKSANEGIMHACGHDVHTTIAAGIALVLDSLKDYLKYNVLVIFQPAEECNPQGGAKLVIEQGILSKFNISEMYGLHIWPKYKVGEIAVKPDAIMGSSDKFSIEVLGKKSHAAEPHGGIDAISISVDIINAIEHKLRREIDPFEVSLISIGSIKSTGRYNVVCDKVEIEGTIRTVSEHTRSFIHRRINELAAGIANSYNGRTVVSINNGYKVVRNDRSLSESFIRFAGDFLGKENVHTDINPSLIGEDFSFYCSVVPSLYFFLGCDSEYPLHSDKFLPKEETIYTAINFMSNYFLRD